MRLRQALTSAVQQLEDNVVGSARMNAEVLLMFTLGVDRAYLYAHPERELSADELTRYSEALEQRSRGIPAQYITGHQEFWGLDFIVTPAVLIPRPETEHLIETVLQLVRDEKRERPALVDVGTGSGCIALALAHELPQADISAVDISPDALEIARANAARLQLSDRVRFARSDLLEVFVGTDEARPTLAKPGLGWGTQSVSDPNNYIEVAALADARFDFVVSNPPYVGEGEEDRVQREVKKFEPRIAVFAGHEGLDTIRRLIPQARQVLKPGGWLLMEIGYTQERSVCDSLDGWAEVRSIPDLQGIPRVIAARKP